MAAVFISLSIAYAGTVLALAIYLKGNPMTIADILAKAQALLAKAQTVHTNVDAHLTADAANTVSADKLTAVDAALDAAGAELDKVNAEVMPAPTAVDPNAPPATTT